MKVQQLTTTNFGQSHLYNNDVLVTKCSSQFNFYIQKEMIDIHAVEATNNSNTLHWVLYHTIKIQGFLFFNRGTTDFQITSDKLVYFYRFNEGDFSYKPEHKSTMFNFLPCTYMSFGLQDQICLSFKLNDPKLTIFVRKLNHGFMQRLNSQDKEGVCGQNLSRLQACVLSEDDMI